MFQISKMPASQWLTSKLLACALIQTASGKSIERGRRDTHIERLTVAVGKVLQPWQLHLRARRCRTAQARMALHQRPPLPERDSKAIHGWPCHPQMAMHVGSDTAAPDWPKRQLEASELERPPRLGWTASWLTGFVG